MKKKVLINLKSIITTDEDTDEIEMTTTGTRSETDTKLIIAYEETDDAGYQNCTTSITCDKEKGAVKLHRSGDYTSDLIVEMGERHTCTYGTPYGSMTIGVSGKSVEIRNDNGVLYITLIYTIDVNTAVVSQNELVYNIRECKD